MVINNEIRDLVSDIENSSADTSSRLNSSLKELVLQLKETTSQPKTVEFYKNHRSQTGTLGRYPIDEDGYAQSFDSLNDEESFLNTWQKYGIVVGKNIINSEVCDKTVSSIFSLVSQIANGTCDLTKPETWTNIPSDTNGTSLISRGFLEIYHHETLAQIRQSVRLYVHHAVLWGRHDLWTSFDRFGIKLPHHEESKALPLHVDQNPLFHPEFKTMQGVLALSDCPVERGTFVGVPGSNSLFNEYKRFAPDRGEYVEIPESDAIHNILRAYAQPIPLRKGDLVTWDSRTAHANSENVSDDTRVVAYIAAGLAREDDQSLIDTRMDAFKTGIGSNVREALMHASKKSRFTDYDSLRRIRGNNDNLTLLGQLLYGQEKYSEL
jgi:hypothetical protein